MGLGSYFKAKKPEPKVEQEMTTTFEKSPAPMPPRMDLTLPPNAFESSRNSIMSAESGWMDDIRHEVMVNYLYQQQCSHMWVSDGSSEMEGVLLRKSRNTYMACPQELGNSQFAAACASMNVQVCPRKRNRNGFLLTWFSVP
jgi:hypothetical protein